MDFLIISNRVICQQLFQLVLLSLIFSRIDSDNQVVSQNLLKLTFGNTTNRRLES